MQLQIKKNDKRWMDDGQAAKYTIFIVVELYVVFKNSILVQSSALGSVLPKAGGKLTSSGYQRGYNGVQMLVLIKRLVFGADSGESSLNCLLSNNHSLLRRDRSWHLISQFQTKKECSQPSSNWVSAVKAANAMFLAL